MNFWQKHIGDYARQTAHLSLAEDGAYNRMLDLYYSREEPLPKERPVLYRLLRARSREDQKAVDIVLTEFFEERDDGWHKGRCDEEIAKANQKSEKARMSADKRWQSEGTARNDAKAMRTHSDGNATRSQKPEARSQAPDANGQKPETKGSKTKARSLSALATKPDDVIEKVWNDFTALRKEKRAPLTDTALAGIKEQAAIAELSLQAALEVCCFRGWQGFQAEWYRNSKNVPRGTTDPYAEFVANGEKTIEGERLAE